MFARKVTPKKTPAVAPAKDANFRQLVDDLPVAVMTCDLETFVIDYANPKSIELLESLRDLLPVDPRDIVGTSIDVFHKHPEHQRQMLSNPANLPHRARIQLGEEVLDLHIAAIGDGKGRRRASLTWSVITNEVRADLKTRRFLQMIDKMPINVMTCDPTDWSINYINQTSVETLRSIEEHLPVKADDMLGTSIDVFHKHPAHQQAMLSDPSNLPHTANIRVGPETLQLHVSAITSEDGSYMGPMVTWSVITDTIRMAESVSDVVDAIASTSSEMDESATQLLEISRQATGLSSSVSSATEELSASIREISSQMSEASQKSTMSVDQAREADSFVTSLAEAAESIGKITEVIEDIAGQTNLLALNATIEAARAGEAGKGFAVVAGEVKSLASKTAQSTDEIKGLIDTIQKTTKSTVEAIRRIGDSVGSMNEISTQVAAAVEEQSAATAEISRNIDGVSQASQDTGGSAARVQDTASALAGRAQSLQGEIDQFLKTSNG